MTTFQGPPLEGFAGIGALTMGGFLDEIVERFGPNEALVFDDPLQGGETVRWTYDDLRREAHRIALGLLENGGGGVARTAGQGLTARRREGTGRRSRRGRWRRPAR